MLTLYPKEDLGPETCSLERHLQRADAFLDLQAYPIVHPATLYRDMLSLKGN